MRLRRAGPSAGLLAGLLLAWEGAVRSLVRPDLVGTVFPLPSGIAASAWARAGSLTYHAVVTLGEVALGLALAFALGVGTALLIFHVRSLERALFPLLIVTQNVPVYAIAPLLVIWFGYDVWPKAIVAALIAFFPVTVNAVDGLRVADPDLVNLFRIQGASRWQILRMLRVPSGLPLFFSGAKVGVTLSVAGAVVGEWVGARAGLGYLMLVENRLLHANTVFAAILWLSALGLGLFYAVAGLERWALRWQRAGAAAYAGPHEEASP